MPFKKHTPEEIIGKLREAEIVLAQGGTTADACRRLSISFYPGVSIYSKPNSLDRFTTSQR